MTPLELILAVACGLAFLAMILMVIRLLHPPPDRLPDVLLEQLSEKDDRIRTLELQLDRLWATNKGMVWTPPPATAQPQVEHGPPPPLPTFLEDTINAFEGEEARKGMEEWARYQLEQGVDEKVVAEQLISG